MTGRTGYTAVSNGDAPDFGGDITNVYEHFDPLIGESVDTAASLPSSGNWVGRTVLVEDTGIQYVCVALTATWVPVNANSGVFRIKPATVAGTGVSLGTNGAVSFTTATAVSLNGVFSSTFDAVRFVFEYTAKSANSTVLCRLRSSGSDISTSNYNSQRTAGSSSGYAGVNQLAQAYYALDLSPGAVSGFGLIDITVVGAALSAPTKLTGVFGSGVGNTDSRGGTVAGHYSASTQVDGITFYPDTGTITGKVRVYGLNNN